MKNYSLEIKSTNKLDINYYSVQCVQVKITSLMHCRKNVKYNTTENGGPIASIVICWPNDNAFDSSSRWRLFSDRELPGWPNLEWVPGNFLENKGGWHNINHIIHRVLLEIKNMGLLYIQHTSYCEKGFFNWQQKISNNYSLQSKAHTNWCSRDNIYICGYW